MRVAAGAIARKWLRERHGVSIRGHLVQLGPHAIPFESLEHVDANPFFVANATIVPELEAFMDALRKAGDSCGAKITVVASGVPVGWGEPVYGRLDADLAAGDDGHQRGEGRRDRRRLRERRAARAPSTPTR